jgi:hypothetical protein
MRLLYIEPERLRERKPIYSLTAYSALSKTGLGLSRNLAGSDFIAAIRAARKDKLCVLADAGLGGMENILCHWML